jgi:hypothetical protein
LLDSTDLSTESDQAQCPINERTLARRSAAGALFEALVVSAQNGVVSVYERRSLTGEVAEGVHVFFGLIGAADAELARCVRSIGDALD